MKKLFAIIGLIGLTASAPQLAHSDVAFSIFISNAPPPPRVAFVHEPRFVLVPAEQVYYCDDGYSDYDLFQYGSYYYMFDDGYWYRANSYSGPFVAIRLEYVPRQIFYVSDYGYRWRQAPQWGSRSYSRWDSGDRRFRDWRVSDRQYGSRQYSSRYSSGPYSGSRYADRQAFERRDDGRQYVRSGRTREVLSAPWRNRQEVRSGVRSDQVVDRDRSWSDNDRRESRSTDGDRQWRGRSSGDGDDNDNDRGRGHGKGKGKGNGKGHGRGHD